MGVLNVKHTSCSNHLDSHRKDFGHDSTTVCWLNPIFSLPKDFKPILLTLGTVTPLKRFRGSTETTKASGVQSATSTDGLHRQLTRRDLLGGTGAAVAITLAGCTGLGGTMDVPQDVAELPPATLSMETVANPELPARVLYSIGTEDDSGRRVELMDKILDGGTTVERTHPPLPEDKHIYYDDAVYVLSHEIIDQTPATSYQIRVDIVQGTVVESEAVQFSNLPAIDQEKLAAHGWADGGSFGYGTSSLYTHAEREKSALVPESEYSYIVWEDGSEAAWFVDGSYETTLNTYEYSAEQYSTAAEYGQRMREQLAFELGTLSDGEADIVQTAIDEDQYAVDHEQTPSPAFWSLAERFQPHDQAHGLEEDNEGALSGPYFVQYDAEAYWTVLLVNVERPETQTAG